MFSVERPVRFFLFSVVSVVLVLFLAHDVYAHARWFIPQNEALSIPTLKSIREGIFESGVFPAIVVIAIFLVITLFGFIEQVLFRFIKPVYYLAFMYKDRLTYFLKVTVALSLLYSSWKLTFLVPKMPVPEGLLLPLVGIQTLIALMFLGNYRSDIASLLLLLCYAFLFYTNYWIALEHMEIVGISLFILLNESKSRRIRFVKHEAVTILRVCTGFALIFLGLGEKILQPEVAASFLAGYDVNFMKLFFFPEFSDRYFAMCAGLAEVMFGLMFVFGYSIRLLTLTLFSLMVTTNIYMLLAKSVDLAILELAGHLPFIGIVVQMLAFGDGKNITIRKTSYAKYPMFHG